MKAAVFTKYGTPQELKIKEVDTPNIKPDDVLIQVKACSINSWDWDMLRGEPKIYRLLFGLFKPKHQILGCDVAGEVVAIGEAVKKFKIGDAVYADNSSSYWGGFAEFAKAKEGELALKPDHLSFEEAAASGQAAVLAFQGLEKFDINEKSKVLINGAGGGVGTFALQFAKSYGAEVTAVDFEHKLAFLKQLGADHTIDCGTTNFTLSGGQYDFILDVIANQKPSDYRKVLKSGGQYIMMGGKVNSILAAVLSRNKDKKVGVLAHRPNPEDLLKIAEFIKSQNLQVVIDKVFPLEETAQAFSYFGRSKFIGNIVIKINEDKHD